MHHNHVINARICAFAVAHRNDSSPARRNAGGVFSCLLNKSSDKYNSGPIVVDEYHKGTEGTDAPAVKDVPKE